MANIVRHKKFTFVEFVGSNNNKFWNITEFDDGSIETHWGRVGATGNITKHSAGQKNFDSLVRSKITKGYSENKSVESLETKTSSSSISNIGLKDIAKKQIKVNNKLVEDLIDYLSKVNIHNIVSSTSGGISYDSSSCQFKTPQGVIIPDQVNEARDLLSDMLTYIKNKEWDDKDFCDNLRQYLRLIPHDFGMRRINPSSFLPDIQAVQKENDLLDGLEASFNDIVNSDTKNKNVVQPVSTIFDVQLTLLDDKDLFNKIRDEVNKTKQRQHSCSHLNMVKLYEICIVPMQKAFEKDGLKVGKVQSLYHGTKAHNVLSIMKKGLVIPSESAAHVTGSMFGRGAYFANSSTKSLNYSYGYWDGKREKRCFMFIADVALGKHYTPNRTGGYLPSGYDSIWAKANVSGVMNDEIVVFRTSQANFKYLLEFEY